MKKLAILLTSSGWGGLEMNIAKLSKLLMNIGWEITLITTERAVHNNNKEGIHYSSLRTIKPTKKYLDINSARRITKILTSSNIQILFIGYNRDIDLATLIKRLFFKSLKIVYQQHMQLGINKKDPIHTLRYRSIDKWITPLPWLKNEIIKRTYFPKDRIEVIPLGADVDGLVQRKYSKEEARKKLNINGSGTLIGVIGRIDPDKGQRFLIEAVIGMRAKGVDIQLLIFGSPTVNSYNSQEYYEEIVHLVNKNDMSEHIHFVGHSKNVQLFYNAVDIFTMASKSETYGMVTIESMLSGVLVIGTNSGGTPEILENGKLGLVYDYNNLDDYCSKVLWVLNNKKEADELAKAAKLVASSKYSQVEEAKQIDKLLMTLN